MAMETENSPGIAWNLSTGHGADEWTWNRCVPGQPAGASAVRVGSRREAPFDMDDRGRKKLQKPCEDSAFLGMKRAHTLQVLLNGARQVYSEKHAQAEPLQVRQEEVCGAERPTEYCGGMCNCECNSPEARVHRAQAPTLDNFKFRSLDSWLVRRVEPAAACVAEANDSKSGMDWAAGGLPMQVPEAALGHGQEVAMQADAAATSNRCASCGRCDGFAWEDCMNDVFLERAAGAVCIDCYSSGRKAEE